MREKYNPGLREDLKRLECNAKHVIDDEDMGAGF